MYVCHCEAVTDQAVDAAIASGAGSVSDVTSRCRAGGGCGGCHDYIQALIDAVSAVPVLDDSRSPERPIDSSASSPPYHQKIIRWP